LVLHLSELLEVPLRERNGLLLAAGYAPLFTQRTLDDDSSGMLHVRKAVSRLLATHEPYPALVIDRHWNIVDRNHSTRILAQGVAPELLKPPVNALRMALHPSGMAPRIINLAEWSGYLLRRLEHQLLVSGDPLVASLTEEIRSYPGVAKGSGVDPRGEERVVIPLRLRGDRGDLCFLNMVATFGSAVDVMTSELVIESFYPADDSTVEVLLDESGNRDRHLSSGGAGLEDSVGRDDLTEAEDPHRLGVQLARGNLSEDRPERHLGEGIVHGAENEGTAIEAQLDARR